MRRRSCSSPSHRGGRRSTAPRHSSQTPEVPLSAAKVRSSRRFGGESSRRDGLGLLEIRLVQLRGGPQVPGGAPRPERQPQRRRNQPAGHEALLLQQVRGAHRPERIQTAGLGVGSWEPDGVFGARRRRRREDGGGRGGGARGAAAADVRGGDAPGAGGEGGSRSEQGGGAAHQSEPDAVSDGEGPEALGGRLRLRLRPQVTFHLLRDCVHLQQQNNGHLKG